MWEIFNESLLHALKFCGGKKLSDVNVVLFVSDFLAQMCCSFHSVSRQNIHRIFTKGGSLFCATCVRNSGQINVLYFYLA